MNALQIHELEEIKQEETQRFKVTDINSLNWALRKMAAIDAKIKEVNALADAEIERIENFRKQELSSLQQSQDFFQGLIGEYALKRRDEDPAFKSEKTPYGRITWTKRQPKWNYNNDEVINYLEENGRRELIRVKKEPVKTEIKKLFQVNEDGRVFDENGQEVPGISVEFIPDELKVKVE